MAPAPVASIIEDTRVATAKSTSKILHRTPWRPPTAVSAQGIYVTLENGQNIIDAVGGASVCCIGNGHPEVIKAVQDQVAKMAYVYNMQLSNEPAEELAKVLIEGGKGAFELCGFVCGGSEAMEAVIKLARQYFYEINQPQRVNFISRNQSYHGNTIGALNITHHRARRAPYEGILDNDHFHAVTPAYAKRYMKEGETEEDFVARLVQELDDKFVELGPETVIGFVAETASGATMGCVPAPPGYFKGVKAVCEKYGALFILDEVMAGMGRVGSMHAWESIGDGASPDIQAVAKGLGGGYATIGAVLMSKKVADGIRDGKTGYWSHGHTYQAHPIAAAASLAVQRVIKSENLLENVNNMGRRLQERLRTKLQSPNSPIAPYVFDIRGAGLFWGIEFDVPADIYPKSGYKIGIQIQEQALKNGLIIMGMSGTIDGVRGDHAILSPAYNVTPDEIDKIVDIFVLSAEQVLQGLPK